MLDYRHMLHMTGDDGILQFSCLDMPDPGSGYTLDDNARALMVSLHLENAYPYALCYSNYLKQAQQSDGSWSNILLDKKYYSTFDSEDSIGRAILACSAASIGPWPDIALTCSNIFTSKLPAVFSFRSPRAIAYALLALCKGNLPLAKSKRQSIILKLMNRLIGLYQNCHGPGWFWFEDIIAYCNGILPQAMFAAYAVTSDKKALRIACDSLNFLNGILFRQGFLNIIGNQAWFPRNGKVSIFDQQPVDAASTVFANFEAYQTLREIEYLELALLAQQWYRGRNINNISLYNSSTGGCYDALTPMGINLNQGAEATLSLLLTDIVMKDFINQEIDISLSS
ncbi:MAG: hypothetical protein PHC92_11195 [Syntrophomonadaceae bacterium]|nr:hypothetical protein [Syntrophomonadaceae bacterium]MDD3022543.1 hypothetical protein [Syntrophomonadaceae bacterium]